MSLAGTREPVAGHFESSVELVGVLRLVWLQNFVAELCSRTLLQNFVPELCCRTLFQNFESGGCWPVAMDGIVS